jgi:hypothetical protein
MRSISDGDRPNRVASFRHVDTAWPTSAAMPVRPADRFEISRESLTRRASQPCQELSRSLTARAREGRLAAHEMRDEGGDADG